MELKFNTFNWNEVIEKVQKMQENVLSQTIHTHKTTPQEEQRGTDFSKKWIWLAAAVVLVLGLF